jgi:hypothetical protein
MRARCRDGSRPRGTVVPGPPGRRCHFPTPGGTRRVPKGAKCAARDPGRAARGDARRNLSSLSGLIWRPSAIVADARVPGASRQASVREICGARSTRRVPKRNESFGDDVRVSAHRQTVTSRCLNRERRVASETLLYRSPWPSPCKKRPVSVKKCVVTIRIHKCLAAASSAASPSLFPSETNASPSPPRSELPVPALAPREPCLSKCLLLARRSIRSRRASLTRPKCGGCGRRRWRPPRGSPRRAACRTATSR